MCVFVRPERNCSGDILISVDLGLLFEIPAGDHYVTWIACFFSLGRNFLWPQIEITSSRILSKLGEKTSVKRCTVYDRVTWVKEFVRNEKRHPYW